MLEIRSLSKIYSNGKQALDSLSLTISPGELIGFIGPNGAGKTTALRIITGVIPPTSGEVLLGGHSITEEPVKAKKTFTFVPDHPEIYQGLRGIQYLNFLGDIYEVEPALRKERIERYARLFQIEDALNQKISSYSHGMKQKLLITGALLPEPQLFILDEPHVGLDPHSAKVLKDLMEEHCEKGGSVLFSSHVLEVVENLCHKVAILHKGRLLAYDTLTAIKADSSLSLEEIFLEMTEDE